MSRCNWLVQSVPTASYRWTSRVWESTDWSSKLKISNRFREIYRPYLKLLIRNYECQHLTGWIENPRISTDSVLQSLRHWCQSTFLKSRVILESRMWHMSRSSQIKLVIFILLDVGQSCRHQLSKVLGIKGRFTPWTMKSHHGRWSFFMVWLDGPTSMGWLKKKSIHKVFGSLTRCKLNVD